MLFFLLFVFLKIQKSVKSYFPAKKPILGPLSFSGSQFQSVCSFTSMLLYLEKHLIMVLAGAAGETNLIIVSTFGAAGEKKKLILVSVLGAAGEKKLSLAFIFGATGEKKTDFSVCIRRRRRKKN